ncbi:MAG: hypothetical protein NTZ05_11160 [Chloroflexi bacterium]|nr:hypothetical protein [Chloroflexota bacterium]
MYAPDREPLDTPRTDFVEEPAAVWVLAGLGAGLVAGVLALACASLLALAAGQPWSRPITLVASLVYGPQIALAPGLEPDWTIAAAALLLPLAAVWGIVYGLLIVAIGFRPDAGLRVTLGLLVGVSLWVLMFVGLAHLAAPITVRMTPAWAVLALSLVYGAALALTLPLSRWILRAVAADTYDEPGAPPRRAPRGADAPDTPWRRPIRRF